MNKTDIIKLVNDEIKKFISNDLDNEVGKILKSKASNTRDELIKTIKNSMESVYKLLWQKRDFWKSDIK